MALDLHRLSFCAAAADTLKCRSYLLQSRGVGDAAPYVVGSGIPVGRRGDVGIAPYERTMYLYILHRQRQRRRKSTKRRQRRMKRVDFEEVSRLAAAKRSEIG